MTIKEVANELGVSVATVSRALIHPELLKEDTRERVLAVIDRLGYQPNLIARDLRRAGYWGHAAAGVWPRDPAKMSTWPHVPLCDSAARTGTSGRTSSTSSNRVRG